MAISDIQTNNKLIKFTQQINREWVRENMFSPVHGDDLNAIIRKRMELKAGGEVMNIPLVTRLQGVGVSTGPLVGNEDKIDDYGYADLAGMVPQCGGHHQGRTAEGQRRHLRRGQAAAVGLAQSRLPATRSSRHSWRCHRKASRRPALASTASSTICQRRRNATLGAPTTSTAFCTVPRHRNSATDHATSLGQRGRHRRQVDGAKPVAAQACCDGRQPAHSALQDPRSGYEYYRCFRGAQYVPRSEDGLRPSCRQQQCARA